MRTITVGAIDQEHEVSPWLWLFPEWVESFFCRCTAESTVKGLLCHLGGHGEFPTRGLPVISIGHSKKQIHLSQWECEQYDYE
jgi:hypothetical protein